MRLIRSMWPVSNIFFKCVKMQMVINLAPVSPSNKKSELSGRISEPLNFKILLVGVGGACPQTLLEACAFGARNLPHLVQNSCYGPAFGSNNFSLKAKQSWNTETFCRLTDAFKGVFPSL